MALVRQKQTEFRPVTVTLESQEEYDAFLNLLNLARNSNKVLPASAEERLVTSMSQDMADGIKVQQ